MQRHFFRKFSFILFTGLLLLALGNTRTSYGLTNEEIQAQIDAQQKAIQALQAQADAYRTSLSETEQLAKTLKGQIKRYDSTIAQLKLEITITERKIQSTQLKIQELNNDIVQTSQEVDTQRKALGAVLVNINDLDHRALLIALLQSNQLSDFMGEYANLASLDQGLLTQVNRLKQTKSLLQTDLSSSQAAKQDLQSLSSSLGAQKQITQNQKQDRQTLLVQTNDQQKNYQQLLQDTLKKQEDAQKEIFNLEAALRQQVVFSALPAPQPGLFYWPVDGGHITQGYGPVPFYSNTYDFYKFHNGIDIGAPTGVGTPIHAVFDGIVEATGNDGRYAYGRWIGIKHPNGLTTLYAHLSLIGVSVGQAVIRGQIIGYMGRTGLALGPHLHLGVYASNTFRVDPRWYGLLPLGGSVDPTQYF